MTHVRTQDTAAIEKLGQATNHAFNPATDVVLSRHREDTGEVLGGFIFTGLTETSVVVHAAGLIQNWLNRLLIWATADYAFRQLGCLQVIAPIASDNIRSFKLARHAGFRLVAIIPDYYAVGVAQHVLCLRHQDCVWLYRLSPRIIVEQRGNQQVLRVSDG